MSASLECFPPDVVSHIFTLGVESGWTKRDMGSFAIQSKTTLDVVRMSFSNLYMSHCTAFFNHIGLLRNSYVDARAVELEAVNVLQDLDQDGDPYRVYCVFRRKVGNTFYFISDPVKAGTGLRFTRLNKDYYEMQTRVTKPTDIAVPAELEVGVVRGSGAWRTISKRVVPSLRRVATEGGAYMNFDDGDGILTQMSTIGTWRGVMRILCNNSRADERELAGLFQ